MSLPTFIEASDAILGLFRTAWNAGTPAYNGGTDPLPVQWPGVDTNPQPPPGAFARIVIRHSGSDQTTLGQAGARRFTRRGQVFVQVFAPLTTGQGSLLAQNLAIIARNAFEGVGTDDGIWFREVTIREIGNSGTHYQINVSAAFEYDELK